MDRKTAERRSETDRLITDNAQGPAERAVLGTSSRGAMIRIVLFVALFVLVGGTLVYVFNPLSQ